MSNKSAVKTSLFAAEEREQKLDRKGDLLATLEKHVRFDALAAMGGKLIRSIGLARTVFGLSLKASVYNLRRLCALNEGRAVPL